MEKEQVIYKKLSAFAEAKKTCPEWIRIKNRYDSGIPEKGTIEHIAYLKDMCLAQKALEKLAASIF